MTDINAKVGGVTPPLQPTNPAYNTYVGARYVPIFAGTPGSEWTDAVAYEPLTIVIHEGNSYTSKTFVPVGVDIGNGEYWALTGNYNAQVELYRQEVLTLSKNTLVTPQKYGAKADGVTDDSEAIQKCFNQNDLIYFPAGVYNVTKTININKGLTIIGSGYTESVIKSDNITLFNIAAEWDTRGLNFSNIGLLGSGAPGGITGNGIGVYGCTNETRVYNIPFISFDNCEIRGFEYGVQIEGYGHLFLNTKIRHCTNGVELIHPEQCSMINTWIEYCTTGLLTNVRAQKYGHSFIYLGGAIQRCETGARLQNIGESIIRTYCELNNLYDILMGDPTDQGNYTKGCKNIEININTSPKVNTTCVQAYSVVGITANVVVLVDFSGKIFSGNNNTKYAHLYLNNEFIKTTTPFDQINNLYVYIDRILTYTGPVTQNQKLLGLSNNSNVFAEFKTGYKNGNGLVGSFTNGGIFIDFNTSNVSGLHLSDNEHNVTILEAVNTAGIKEVKTDLMFSLKDSQNSNIGSIRLYNGTFQFRTSRTDSWKTLNLS